MGCVYPQIVQIFREANFKHNGRYLRIGKKTKRNVGTGLLFEGKWSCSFRGIGSCFLS